MKKNNAELMTIVIIINTMNLCILVYKHKYTKENIFVFALEFEQTIS